MAGLMICVAVAGIAGSLLNRKIPFPAKSTVVILACCFLLIFGRKWVTFDFDTSLLVFLSCLLLLFFIIQQTVALCPPQYLFGTIIVFAFTLSVQGTLIACDQTP